jgi:hypothetical protein
VIWKLTRIVCVERVTGLGEICCRLIWSRRGGARRSTSITPVPGGQPVVPDGAVTTAVWADWAALEPVVFVAVTHTPIVRPESAVTSV